MHGTLNDTWLYMQLVSFLWTYAVKVVEWNCSKEQPSLGIEKEQWLNDSNIA